jgi:hypothetical protein
MIATRYAGRYTRTGFTDDRRSRHAASSGREKSFGRAARPGACHCQAGDATIESFH